jgi:hypothetical protein
MDGQNFTSCNIHGKMCWEISCDNYVAGTLQYKCSQFSCYQGQNSTPVSGEHKPLTFPLISLALCRDIWLKVWTAALEFVHRLYFVFEKNCTWGVCFREVFSGAVRLQWDTLGNVYITKRTANIFIYRPNFESLNIRRQYHRKKGSYRVIYTSSDNVLSQADHMIVWFEVSIVPFRFMVPCIDDNSSK